MAHYDCKGAINQCDVNGSRKYLRKTRGLKKSEPLLSQLLMNSLVLIEAKDLLVGWGIPECSMNSFSCR